jgi:hypothetical protein
MWQAIANLEPWSGHDIQDLNNKLNSGLCDQTFWLKLVIAFLRFYEHKHRHILFVMFLLVVGWPTVWVVVRGIYNV